MMTVLSAIFRFMWIFICSGWIISSTYAQLAIKADDVVNTINQHSELKVYPVRKNIFLVIDPAGGTNVTVQIGDEGALVVDSGSSEKAESFLEVIRQLTAKPIRFLLNTNSDPAYAGGNVLLASVGRGYASTSRDDDSRVDGIAHENALLNMVFDNRFEGAPNLAFINTKQSIFFNGETVELRHQPAATESGNSIVFFRSSDVLSTGPIFLTTSYPDINLDLGGSINGLIDGLNGIIDITNTQKNQEGGTLVISGEGGVTDEAGGVEYRDMLTVIRDRIRYYMAQGMNLEEVQAERPTFDYDPRYATVSGFSEASRFVETIYRSLEAGE